MERTVGCISGMRVQKRAYEGGRKISERKWPAAPLLDQGSQPHLCNQFG